MHANRQQGKTGESSFSMQMGGRSGEEMSAGAKGLLFSRWITCHLALHLGKREITKVQQIKQKTKAKCDDSLCPAFLRPTTEHLSFCASYFVLSPLSSSVGCSENMI